MRAAPIVGFLIILVVEPWLWKHYFEIMAAKPCQWNPSCGILAVESSLWYPGYGILAVESWLWNPDSGIPAVESWLWNPGCGSLWRCLEASGGLAWLACLACLTALAGWGWPGTIWTENVDLSSIFIVFEARGDHFACMRREQG